MRKLMGWLLILGILVINASPPAAPIVPALAEPGVASSRSSALSPSGGESNIDSFNVHPANRWDNISSGSPSLTMADGQLELEVSDADNDSALYFRKSQTADSDISIRFRLNSSRGTTTNYGDIRANLAGLNISSTENISLSAFYWNTTHYTIRAVFTQDAVSRSWNLGSDYQDLFQMDGTGGSDGQDFIENTEDQGYVGLGNEETKGGYYYAQVTAPANEEWLESRDLAGYTLDPAKYSHFEVRMRCADTTVTVQPLFGAPRQYISSATTVGSGWNIHQWDLSTDSNWNASKTWYRWGLHIDEADGTLDGNELFWIDYFRLLSTNDTSDLQFYAYDTYYRANLDFNLRLSEIDFDIQADDGETLVEREIGEFKIDDYFDQDDLIYDIWQGKVGQIDYWFGILSTSTLSQCWWDYYEAEFTEFSFELDTWDPGGEQIVSSDAYALYAILTGIGDANVAYNLTVPEFDACSGIFAINQNHSTAPIDHDARLYVYSVNPSTGVMTEEIIIDLEGTAGGYETWITADGVESDKRAASVNAAPNDLLYGRIGFSIFFDKQQRKLNAQISADDAAVGSSILTSSANVSSSQSNEFVLRLFYRADHSMAGADAEVHIILEDWTLTFRDWFGLPIDLPNVGDVAGFGSDIFDILLIPLRAIEIAIGVLQGLISGVISVLNNILTGILNIVTELVDIEAILNTIDTTISGVTSAVNNVASAVIDGLDDLLQDIIDGIGDLAGDIWDQFDTILTNISNFIQAVAQDLVDLFLTEAWEIVDALLTEFVAMVRAFDILGVNLGDFIDLVDEWVNLSWGIMNSIISLGTEMLTVWTQVFLMGLLGVILIWAAATCNQNGAVFMEKLVSALSINISPISILGTGIRIPLAVPLLGNLFWVVFTSYDWEGFLVPAFVIASFHYGEMIEIPDISDQWDIFFDFMNTLLEDLFETLFEVLVWDVWAIFVGLVDSDILGASPEIIIFVITAGIAASLLIRGRW